jgi:hypothetical protein
LSLAAEAAAQGTWLPGYNHPIAANMVGSAWVPAPPAPPLRWRAINMALIPNSDNVIVWDSNSGNQALGPSLPWPQRFAVGNPETGVFDNRELSVPAGLGDLFCSGHTWLPDGRLFVAGGNSQYPCSGCTPQTSSYKGSVLAYIWDPLRLNFPDQGWARLPDMQIPRWYPTVTLTGDGKVMVAGGTEDTAFHYCGTVVGNDRAFDTYEVWDIQLNSWESEMTPQGPVPLVYPGPSAGPGSCFAVLGEYPRQHLVSNNRIFMAGMFSGAERVRFVNSYVPSAAVPRRWESRHIPPGESPTPGWPIGTGNFRGYGTSVLVPNIGNTPGGLDQVMILGGLSNGVILDTFRLIDGGATAATPAWTPTAPMGGSPARRMFPNAVLLPNGDVFVCGGITDGVLTPQPTNPNYIEYYDGRAPANLSAAIYRKTVTPSWMPAAQQPNARRYHSTALLLPSGRVVTAGGERQPSATDKDYDLYEPDYMAVAPGLRPEFAGTWSGGPAIVLQRGVEYEIEHVQMPPGESVARAVLMRPGSTTHHHDADQRYVELDPSPYAEYPYDAQRIVSMKAPGGFYMLFLVSTRGVPSVARWVFLQ